ncbi:MULTISPECIES: CDP-alcohol phosphatidyltransferase family protein [Kandleria]|jgi:CDP-diacylglycerol--serine O-phosphatidyltransferase|nr:MULTISPECIES: CDP-alcohol phosphatidyltransferase family protein [Kandleria]MBP3276177.1 CDP-alcohol phosphatidyltransferase family protein [Kandleria sp.]MEE0988225.1 CDP-alcohol phosphatidyltransferase family protein [Kandleria vitulina]SDM15829.1 CDP-diacylglycerol---serine O-phosphatidyltransferase [Kandleria vitulina]SEJ11856.1 CDP-diacylglycerol---serine O-phosphatidyltransferase [Kandleria vitulina]
MIGFYNYTVILTYCSLVSALIGTHFAFQHQYVIALLCLMLCGFFDSFDGIVARSKKNRTEEEKMFGIQIDSLVDLVSFGVFPAVIAYSMGRFTMLRCLPFFAVYVLGAVIRLAYFNVTEDMRQKKTSEKRKYYTGLPVTSSSIIFPAIYCLNIWFKIPTVQMIYFVGLGIVGILFISKIKVPKPDLRGILILIALGIILFISLAITGNIRMGGGHPFGWLYF